MCEQLVLPCLPEEVTPRHTDDEIRISFEFGPAVGPNWVIRISTPRRYVRPEDLWKGVGCKILFDNTVCALLSL